MQRQHDPALGPSGCSIALTYVWSVFANVLVVCVLVAIFKIPTSRFERIVVMLLALLLVSSSRASTGLLDQLNLVMRFILAHIKATADLAPDTEQSIRMRDETEQIIFEMDRAFKHGQIISKITGLFEFVASIIIIWQMGTLLLEAG